MMLAYVTLKSVQDLVITTGNVMYFSSLKISLLLLNIDWYVPETTANNIDRPVQVECQTEEKSASCLTEGKRIH